MNVPNAAIPPPPALAGWRQTFASLTLPDYSQYFAGMVCFFFGMNMMIVVRGALVYDITGNPNALGLIMLSVSLPMLVVAPIGGVIADRVDKRALMIWAQIAVTAVNLVNTVLIMTGVIEFWHLLIMSVLSGVAFSFNMPTRQAIIPSLVPRHMMMNAMSLGSSAMNATRIVAPAIGGLLIPLIGYGGAFAVLTAMYALSVLFTVRLPSVPPVRDGAAQVTFFSDFAEGFRYIRGNRLIFGLLLLGTVPMIFAMPYQTLLPVFAEDVFGVGEAGLGIMMAMAGVGGLAGGLMVANMDNNPRKGRIMLGAAIFTGLFLFGFALSPNILIALPMLILVGLTQMIFMTVNNTVITTVVPDNVRGRVMSVLMMSFGLAPFGAVPASAVADALGAPVAIASGAVLLVAFVALAVALFPQFRTLDDTIRVQRADRDEEHARRERIPIAAGR